MIDSTCLETETKDTGHLQACGQLLLPHPHVVSKKHVANYENTRRENEGMRMITFHEKSSLPMTMGTTAAMNSGHWETVV